MSGPKMANKYILGHKSMSIEKLVGGMGCMNEFKEVVVLRTTYMKSLLE
jgi:hypothetical protein